ncbi:transposase [Enterococcus faecalis]|uniref:Transposase n=1 Tax=Enterococcus faecalis TaxID=1351 RepID=A0A974NYN1_ENTFL|nr:transposase [Enterococcus faecalis]
MNAVNHEVIDIVENRQQHNLSDYFMRYSLNARLRVKTVTMDMYSPYIGLIKACFLKADIIIDRFHIVQHLNRALNHVRIQRMNSLRYTRPRDYRKLKKQWKLVLKTKQI